MTPDLERLLAPVLRLSPAGEDPTMLATVGEGLSLPDPTSLERLALPAEKTGRLLRETVEWLAAVLRPEFVPADVGSRLKAVRGAADGQDAFVGAWAHRDRPVQAVVTGTRIHIMTRAPGRQADPVDAALFVLREMLRLPAPPPRESWTVRSFAGAVLGHREIDFARNWDETVHFLTDGNGVKISMLKYRNRTSEKHGGKAMREIRPWFPR